MRKAPHEIMHATLSSQHFSWDWLLPSTGSSRQGSGALLSQPGISRNVATDNSQVHAMVACGCASHCTPWSWHEQVASATTFRVGLPWPWFQTGRQRRRLTALHQRRSSRPCEMKEEQGMPRSNRSSINQSLLSQLLAALSQPSPVTMDLGRFC